MPTAALKALRLIILVKQVSIELLLGRHKHFNLLKFALTRVLQTHETLSVKRTVAAVMALTTYLTPLYAHRCPMYEMGYKYKKRTARVSNHSNM